MPCIFGTNISRSFESLCIFRLSFQSSSSLFTSSLLNIHFFTPSKINSDTYINSSVNMLFRATILAFAGLASACVQQPTGALGGNPIGQPTLNQIVPVGKPFTITWNVSIIPTSSLQSSQTDPLAAHYRWHRFHRAPPWPV